MPLKWLVFQNMCKILHRRHSENLADRRLKQRIMAPIFMYDLRTKFNKNEK